MIALPKESTSYYVILGIMSLGANSGYDIKKKIEAEIGYFYKVSNGQIYPTLKKMVNDHSANFVTEKNDGRPDRKIYSITEKGLGILKEWLALPIDLQVDNENELLLKLYFGSIEPIQNNIALVKSFREIKEHNLRTYNKIAETFNLNSIKQIPEYYSFFTLRFGQLVAKAYIDWSHEIIKVLQDLDEKNKSL